MHVALLTWSSLEGYGGAESFLKLLADRLSASGVRVTIVSPAASVVPRIERWHHPAMMMRDFFDASIVEDFSGAFTAFLQREAVSIVHSHNLHIPMSPHVPAVVERACRRHSIPHVLTVYDVTNFRGANEELKKLRETVVVTLSGYNRSHIARATGRRATIVPVGIDFTRYRVTPEHDDRTVAVLGRLEPMKGIHEALASLADVAGSESAPLRVLLSERDGPTAAQSAGYIRDLERTAAAHRGLELEFLTGVDPVPEALRRAALTIVRPCAPEGFGLVALESLASGRPVVALPTGGMRGWMRRLPGVLRLGAAGEGLGNAVSTIFEQWPLWFAQAVEARARLEPRFGIEAVVNAHRQLYERLLASGSIALHPI